MKFTKYVDINEQEERKPDPTSLLSFKLVDGREFFLGYVEEDFLGRKSKKFKYISKDKKYCLTGPYSGGVTGGGITDRYLQKIDGEEFTFIKFYKK